MPSIIEGYTYDIFISYRQNDNKYDGWVTEFVNNLTKELEANIKEKVYVYFDLNPTDGLLETDSVDKSLESKLKCLIFIPIISRTYCDPKSFAWQHEFCAFNKLAKEDIFGRDIKLSSGNVANRILPVKIHDLDPEDESLLENELGGVLRSIDFIYKSAGVNRPLRVNEDHPRDNLNKTYYRDQINKAANAVKEMVSALKRQSQHRDEFAKEDFRLKSEPQKSFRIKIFAGLSIALILITLGFFFIPKLFKPETQLEKSIAVLPFDNMSEENSWFGDAMTDEIIMQLYKIKEFVVRSRTSVMQYKGTSKTSPIIGQELKVNYLIEGSAQRVGDQIRIRVQLINAVTDNHIWGDTFEGNWKDILSIQSDIAKQIADKLKATLTPEEIIKIEKIPTENPKAYDYYLQGNFNYWKVSNSGNTGPAIELYEKAITIDPGFALAYTGIAICYLDQYWYYSDHSEDVLLKSKEAIDKAFEIDPNLPEAHLALGDYYYSVRLDYSKALEEYEMVLKEQPMNVLALLWSAATHRRAGNWEMAKTGFEKTFNLDPRSDLAEEAGETFDLVRDYSRAEEYYNKSIMLQPDYLFTYYEFSNMILRREGDTRKAKEILENAALNNKSSISDSLIIETRILIDIYEGKYEEALKDISLLKYDVVQTQFYYRPKTLYIATIYGLMNKTELEQAYYDSARIFLENRMADMPEDQRLISSLGIAYAGLGLDEKAITAGKKAVKLMPVEKEAYKGPFLVENLALIYVMTGKYDEALKQINYLLSIPGFLSVKILETDPRWAPLKNNPEFKKILEK